MAFSTQYYYVKPIIPRIKHEFSIYGITLRKLSVGTNYLLSEPFLSSSRFYYENDSEFAHSTILYLRELRAADHLYVKDHRQGYYTTSEEQIAITKAINKINDQIVLPRYFTNQQKVTEEIATPKELSIWLKETFKQRKRKIQKFYPKKKYFEFHFFLNVCNDFLKSLGNLSLKYTDTLDIFFEIGSNLDWFLLNITECPYHKSIEFQKLFSSNVAVKNDYIKIAGIFTILNHPNAFELYMANNEPFLEKLQQYTKIFQELLLSGNEIIELETLRIKAEKETERLSRELKQKKDKEEKFREIQSMHDIAIDRKIWNIERIGDGVGQNEKNSNDSYL